MQQENRLGKLVTITFRFYSPCLNHSLQELLLLFDQRPKGTLSDANRHNEDNTNGQVGLCGTCQMWETTYLTVLKEGMGGGGLNGGSNGQG